MGPYVPYSLFQTTGERCAKFGSDRFRNVDLYKVQTNKQTFIFIYKIMYCVRYTVVNTANTVVNTLSRRAAAGRSPAEILGSNPTGGMDICLL